MSEKLNFAYGIFTTLFGIAVLLGSASFGYDAYNSYAETQNEIANSVKTTGQITDNGVEKKTVQTYEGTRTEYIFTAKYKYQVGNDMYVSDSVEPCYSVETLSSRSSANEYKNKYAVGDQVTVNYLPSRHTESYLETTSGSGGFNSHGYPE